MTFVAAGRVGAAVATATHAANAAHATAAAANPIRFRLNVVLLRFDISIRHSPRRPRDDGCQLVVSRSTSATAP